MCVGLEPVASNAVTARLGVLEDGEVGRIFLEQKSR